MIAGVTWAISGALAAIAAVLAGLDRAIDPLIGWNYQISIFAAAILGGLGSPVGAVAGALLIGVADVAGKYYLSSALGGFVIYVVLIIVLVIRPNGLFARAR